MSNILKVKEKSKHKLMGTESCDKKLLQDSSKLLNWTAFTDLPHCKVKENYALELRLQVYYATIAGVHGYNERMHY